jgi:hypothetical protein
MSAGQLAALIISFTPALNKKYSLNKILFIDDPVQTVDALILQVLPKYFVMISATGRFLINTRGYDINFHSL